MAFLEFQQCNPKPSIRANQAGGEVTPTIPWQPPSLGVVKVNWDASIHMGMGCVGFGCVARDHVGNFLGAKVSYQRSIVEPKMAEAISAHRPVLFAKEMGFTDVFFEGMLFKLFKLYLLLLLIFTILDILL